MSPEFIVSAQRLGIELSALQLQQLDLYRRHLQTVNQVMNLTALTSDEDIEQKHFYDALLITRYVGSANTILDVGSGAGFPGMVLAIVFPDKKVTLLEPIGKRCRFLNEVTALLNLEHVTVVNARSEDYVKTDRERYDFVCARAVASLAVLAELCLPLVRVGGVFLAMKGSQGEQEAVEASHAIRVLGGSEPLLHHDELSDGSIRLNLEIAKIKPSGEHYPRPYGKIKKNPL